MLFQSSVKALFNQLEKHYYSDATQKRKEETAKRLDLYHDNQGQALEDLLNQHFADPSKMVRVFLNLTRKIINNLAQIYRIPPSREIDGNPAYQAIYKQIATTAQLDIKLKQASRYTKLLKSILLRPVWRNNSLQVDILTGNILDITTGDSPEILQEVVITDYGDDASRPENVEYSKWTPKTFQRLDYQFNVIRSENNIYQTLPFLPIFDYPPTGSDFWLAGGEDLIAQQEAINLKLVDLLHLLHWQSFGVGFIRNQPGTQGEQLTVGPGSLVELSGSESEIGFVSQKAEIAQVVAAIDQIIKWSCVSHGLTAAAVSTEIGQTSGLSKFWDSQELSEQRVEDKILWSYNEAKLFDLMRLIFNTHSQDKLSDEATLKVNFNDPSRPAASALDEAEAFAFHVNMGTMSAVDIIMKKDPDIRSREGAIVILQQIKSENEQFAANAGNLSLGRE